MVTGGTGFLGRYLLPLLKEHEVLAPSRKQGFDIRNLEAVRSFVSKVDVVVHLAAQVKESAPDLFEVNVNGTRNVADICEELGVRLIFASTCGVYGDTGETPANERRPPHPETPYELSKTLAEHVILSRNIDATILRLALLTGDNRYWRSMKKMARKGFPIVDVGQRWQLLDVRDAARAFVHVLEKKLTGIFNVAHPVPITVEQLYRVLSGGKVRKMPLWLAKAIFSLNIGLLKPQYLRRLVRNRLYDVSRIIETGWKPIHNPLDTLMDVRV